MFTKAIISSFFLFHVVSAIPFPQLANELPSSVTHIAFNEDTGHYIAFNKDGSLYGRYVAEKRSMVNLDRRDSTCAPLSVEEAETLPGWKNIVQYANNNWGDGSRNIVTNPTEYVDYGALVCIQTETVELSFTGEPTCQTNNITTGGLLVGTSGSVSLGVDQGFAAATTLTTTQASTIGVDTSLSVKVGIPEVADVTQTVTMSTSLTNTNSQAASTTYNDVVSVTITMDAPEGKTCNAISSTNRCTLQATGDVKYIASGWVWFNYESRKDGHYKWAVSIEATNPNIDDRSSTMKVTGSVEADTHVAYSGECV
ncbi:hypothetical protein K435DRAFT_903581 [Dendrothele bispora CBS 962.96]|uniref:Uncharacterized protein n=1 Tax=Dendrothele bispora (strain CBS 962.96) TaxID=1314807 RepID=A0A4S8LV66_DENBC|nr:hypothetical protein K435DRAFT_903581 [Dendrothele bispora CBS 962.96]